MQAKTIERNIKAKMEKWLETITDEKLRKDVKENLLVSGGCIASMFLNEEVKDYDVYGQLPTTDRYMSRAELSGNLTTKDRINN